MVVGLQFFRFAVLNVSPIVGTKTEGDTCHGGHVVILVLPRRKLVQSRPKQCRSSLCNDKMNLREPLEGAALLHTEPAI